jgi:hypothetical protein
MSKLTIEDAAAKLGVKAGDLADAGEKYGLPWAKANAGTEYVWRKEIHPTSSRTVIRTTVYVVAGTHGAARSSLAIPEFDPDESPPADEPHWPNLIWRPADERTVQGGRRAKSH